MCVWIPFILLKTENNKKNNKKITVHFKITVHVPVCTVNVPKTVQKAQSQKKKKKKNPGRAKPTDSNYDFSFNCLFAF